MYDDTVPFPWEMKVMLFKNPLLQAIFFSGKELYASIGVATAVLLSPLAALNACGVMRPTLMVPMNIRGKAKEVAAKLYDPYVHVASPSALEWVPVLNMLMTVPPHIVEAFRKVQDLINLVEARTDELSKGRKNLIPETDLENVRPCAEAMGKLGVDSHPTRDLMGNVVYPCGTDSPVHVCKLSAYQVSGVKAPKEESEMRCSCGLYYGDARAVVICAATKHQQQLRGSANTGVRHIRPNTQYAHSATKKQLPKGYVVLRKKT
jgi:hypothetical protein